MTDLAKLVVKLEAQTADYQRKLERAQRQNMTFSQKARLHFGDAKAAYIGFAAAVGGAFATIAKGLERQADLFDLSTRLGATTEGLSQLQYAAEQSGVGVSTLNMGLQRMVRRVAEAASGTGEARGALEELNIAASDLNQLKPEKQFAVLADAIMKVENPADRVRLAMKLFDSEGVSLIQTMQGGSAQLAAFAAEADKLGVTVGDDTAAAAKRATDAFTRLGGVFTGAANTLAGQFAPEIELAANFLAENLPKATVFVRQAFANLQRSALAVTQAFVDLRVRFNEFTGDAEEAESLRRTSEILQQMQNDIANQSAALSSGGESVGAYGERVRQASYALEDFSIASKGVEVAVDKTTQKMAQASEEIPAFWQEAQESFEVASSMLEKPVAENTKVIDKFFGQNAIENLFSDLDRIEDKFKTLIVNMVAEAARSGIASMFSGGTFGGGVTGFFGGLFGGARANGGPVSPTSAYMVGERGPEMFVPHTSGNIVPAHQTGSAGGGVTSVVAALGDSEIEKWLGGKTGERVVLAHIRRNTSTVKALASA